MCPFLSVVNKTMERLVMQRFMYDVNSKFPTKLQQLSTDSTYNDEELTNDVVSLIKKIVVTYEPYRNSVR